MQSCWVDGVVGLVLVVFFVPDKVADIFSQHKLMFSICFSFLGSAQTNSTATSDDKIRQ